MPSGPSARWAGPPADPPGTAAPGVLSCLASMNPDAEQMRRELVIAHPGLMERELVRVYTEMGRAVKMIPAGSSWTVAEAEIAIYAHREGQLFVAAMAPGEPRVALSSRRLDPAKLSVQLEWEEGRPNEEVTLIVRGTRWTFRHPGIERESWQRIDGRISVDHQGEERLDQREMFARALATFAGWESFA